MSATATPIPPSQFALAIRDLPLPNLHFKAAEIRNQIAHLTSSNEQLAEFTDDSDCKEAISENEVVMGRMRERLDLLKAEVEGRGNLWIDDSEQKEETQAVSGDANGTAGEEVISNGDIAANRANEQAQAQPAQSGRLTDEELRAMLRARMGDPTDEDEEGVYL
ncbi:hypothetical protein FKW77_000163 [Venturia effusa]|uniref:Uncharacterized protein n=1 Tax=Venturia effusa TaxID=50376 RepID=A0A517LER9_9PEZI|nr:hypothetical protein FKW77_000163 [Venturia effusa]